MEQDLLNIMMNGGSNALFAGFLLWQYKEQQKRADSRESKQEAREKDIRDRYDKVISDMQERESQMRETLVKEISELDKQMSLLEQKLVHINKIVEEIKQKFVRVG